MMKRKKYRAAVYVRLSKEDGDVADAKKAESNSISNQKSLILNFIETKDDIEAVSVHEDDGYTGSNFDRPGFRRMMDEIEAGKVDCCVVKDLSRFGREYISAGNYIQRVFPVLGVRFIAITDNVDTARALSPVNDVVIPFKNLMNDAFCLDTSVKIRTQLEAKRKNGEFVGSFCPYGYRKSPEERNRLVPDGDAASVVKDIFRWIKRGMSPDAISRRLNDSGIQSPMEYKQSCGSRYRCNFKSHDRARWSAVAVRRIATNPVYIGTLEQGKVSTPNHKVKKRFRKESGDVVSCRNVHEPVISEADFYAVQRLLAADMRTAPGQTEAYLLAGLCKCADCGAPMIRNSAGAKGRRYIYYICSDNKRYGICSPHRIRTEKLEQAVTDTLRDLTGGMARGEVPAAVPGGKEAAEEAARREAELLRRNDEELERCDRTLARLYDDYRNGTVDERDFGVIKRDIVRRRTEAEKAKKAIAGSSSERRERISRLERMAEEFGKYQGLKEFDRSAVVSLVREVRVHTGGGVEVVLDCDDEYARPGMERRVV